jgi:hypothetical protein
MCNPLLGELERRPGRTACKEKTVASLGLQPPQDLTQIFASAKNIHPINGSNALQLSRFRCNARGIDMVRYKPLAVTDYNSDVRCHGFPPARIGLEKKRSNPKPL